jgi:ABC-type uncharacterized transport system auxiliary subunit
MRTVLLLLLIPLFFTACRSNKSIQNYFYMLEMPATVVPEMPERITPLQGSYHLQNVEVAPAFASYQIVLREESHSIRYFEFNQWALRPENNMTELANSFFSSYQFFEKMLTGRLIEAADYMLTTRVHRMEVNTQTDSFVARLVVEFSLVDNNTGEVLHHHHADRSRVLPQRNLNLFAAAISELFTEELAGFTLQMLQDRTDIRRQ